MYQSIDEHEWDEQEGGWTLRSSYIVEHERLIFILTHAHGAFHNMFFHKSLNSKGNGGVSIITKTALVSEGNVTL